MLHLREQVFGPIGFSSNLKLSPQELQLFRTYIQNDWLRNIESFCPQLLEEATKLGIENYHLLSDKLDHKKIWHKSNRVLPQEVVNEIKKFSFFSQLKQEFGEFSVSDVIDTKQHHGREEIYWRLVRPHVASDIGPLHKDSWFHNIANSGYGMYNEKQVTVKVWIPIFCEPGKSGLALSPGSHLKEWSYHIEESDGMARPVPDEDLSTAGAALIPTEPGNMLLFNENILHGGVVNEGAKTRVSVEITMVMERANFPELSTKTKSLEDINS